MITIKKIYHISSYFVSVKQKIFQQAPEENLQVRQETGNIS